MKNVPALFVKAAQAFMKSHKHQFIFAGGVAGTLATGATGVRSGIRIEKKRREQEILKGDLTKKDILKIALPELVPVALSAGGSIGCQTANLVSFTKEVNALTAGIASLSTQIDNMRTAERDILGPEKAEEVQKKANELSSMEPVESPTGKYWFKEEEYGAEVYTTEAEVWKALGELNNRLTFTDATLNDFFFYMDKADGRRVNCKGYDNVGWRNGTKVGLRPFFGGLLDNGTPCKVIKFDKKPLASERKW